jgi:tripartite-type tricarboxylate transporter receptor subunit TctC
MNISSSTSHLSTWRRLCLVALSVTLVGALSPVSAQGSDTRATITWLVGFPPGGTADAITRGVAQQLTRLSGQTVVVENRPGASGALALQQAAKSAADGNTLITIPGPLLYPNAVPEVGKELHAVAMMALGPMVLVAPSTTAPADFASLLKAMKAAPQQWSFATSGNGTSQHLAGELFNQMAGTQAIHVPYKGGGQAIADVVGAQVPLAVLGASPVLPHIQSGKLKAFAVTTSERLSLLPEVPTFRELGLKGYEASQWFAVAMPATTPTARIQQLNEWINTALDTPAVKELVSKSGNVRGNGSPQSVESFLIKDGEKWNSLAAKIKLKFE